VNVDKGLPHDGRAERLKPVRWEPHPDPGRQKICVFSPGEGRRRAVVSRDALFSLILFPNIVAAGLFESAGKGAGCARDGAAGGIVGKEV